MQISSNGYTQANQNAVSNSNIAQKKYEENQAEEKKILSVEEEIEKSAVQVSISMNAQILLFAMDSNELSKNNTEAQKNILDFLSGKDVDGELSLEDIGYEGKPITELSQEEATELISEDGFLAVEQTAQRVADFVFNFSSDDVEILQKGRDGIVQGFEDAKKAWGDELPEISYQTQSRTLELIDEKISQLKGDNET